MKKTPTKLTDYDYLLPEELIAQEPSEKRENSRLLFFQKEEKKITDLSFTDILSVLPRKALIIANNSKVVPARILGHRQNIITEKTHVQNSIEGNIPNTTPYEGGAKVEMLIMTPVPLLEASAQISPCSPALEVPACFKTATAQVLLKGSKRVKIGEELIFHSLTVKIIKKQDFGKHIVEISWKNSLVEELEKYGSLPLPPYIKRPDGLSSHDKTRYQTVYAKQEQAGSVAAPTAGLHFTKDIQEKLLQEGFSWEEVTLHVGYGTFSPVRVDDIREHDMHAEYVEIPERTAKAILEAKATNRPIITIGTTATRTIEGMAQAYATYKENGFCNDFFINTTSNKNSFSMNNVPTISSKNTERSAQKLLHDTSILPSAGCFGYTNIFIYPGKEFRVIDGLVTNFHLPKSSLFMLVSAFAGYENTKQIYTHAIAEKYRFFSYGDAMLILP